MVSIEDSLIFLWGLLSCQCGTHWRQSSARRLEVKPNGAEVQASVDVSTPNGNNIWSTPALRDQLQQFSSAYSLQWHPPDPPPTPPRPPPTILPCRQQSRSFFTQCVFDTDNLSLCCTEREKNATVEEFQHHSPPPINTELHCKKWRKARVCP